MTTTIQQAFRPLFVMCFIIGLCVYPVNKSKFRIKWVVYLSILYSLIVWFVYIYLFYYMVNSLTLVALFPHTISLVVLGINNISTITATILNVYYNKKFQICMKKLAAVDDTLKELGTPKIYKKIHLWLKRIVIGWIVCSFALNFNDTMSWQILIHKFTSWKFIIAHIYNYCFHLNALVDSIFIIFLWYIGNRFDKINEHMQNLLIKKEHWLRNTWKKPTVVHQYILHTDNYKRVLWSSMHLYLELCRIAREWNMIFGMQMALEMASYLLFVTALCYYLYTILMSEYRKEIPVCIWFRIASWAFIFVGKLYIINYICENVSVKATKIEEIINELASTLRYANFWKEIHQFTLQLMHHPLKFSGMGLFYFGNKFLIKFCITIITFLIIIIQTST
ncbi:hypothetical protein P5V15_000911 [Pogonomyrmex californicus]